MKSIINNIDLAKMSIALKAKMKCFFRRLFNLIYHPHKLKIHPDAFLALLIFVVSFFIAYLMGSYNYTVGKRVQDIGHWYRNMLAPYIVADVLSKQGQVAVKKDNKLYADFITKGWLSGSDYITQKDVPRKFKKSRSRFGLAESLCNITASVGWLWKTIGVMSWRSVLILLAVLFGVVNAVAFLLFRQAMGAILSILMTYLYTFSAPFIGYFLNYRDFSRVPAVIAFSMFTIMTIRLKLNWKKIIILSLSAGSVAGLGMGFRQDFLIIVPLMFLGLYFFSSFGVKHGWLQKMTFTFCFAVAFFFFSQYYYSKSKTIKSYGTFHVASVGFSDRHSSKLKLNNNDAYQWFLGENDLYCILLARLIASSKFNEKFKFFPIDIYPKRHGEMMQEYYNSVVTHFPGDIVYRCWISVFKMLQLPFSQEKIIWPGVATVSPTLKKMTWLSSKILKRKFNPGLIIACIAFSFIAVASLSRAFFLFSAMCIVLSIPVVQFEQRHYFVYSFVVLMMAGYVLSLIYKYILILLKHKRRFISKIINKRFFKKYILKRFVLFWVIIILVCVSSIGLSRLVQIQRIKGLACDIAKLDKEEIKVNKSHKGKLTEYTFPQLDFDVLRKKHKGTSKIAEMLVVEFDFSKVGDFSKMPLKMNNYHAPGYRYYSREYKLPIGSGKRYSFVIPAFFYSKTYMAFKNLEIPSIYDDAFKKAYIIKDTKGIALYCAMLWLPLTKNDNIRLYSKFEGNFFKK